MDQRGAPMSEAKVLLMILDGYGFSPVHEHNAIFLAKKPNIDRLMSSCPNSLLETSGRAVGLPPGVMGNSEVGHLNIGSGRVIKQELSKISDFAEETGFETLPDIKRLFAEKSGAIHLFGLLSDGGVHSHEDHLFALLRASKRAKCARPIYVHAITDGRDTPPQSAQKFISNLENVIKETGMGHIATVVGRFYIMDRDKRWERVEVAYKALTQDDKNKFNSAKEAVESAYKEKENDEFIKPRQIQGGGLVKNGDAAIFFNFRADRAREISRALTFKDFKEFPTPVKIDSKDYVTFTRYDESFTFPVLFKPESHDHILGELVAEHKDKQLRIAETEKYAHVTYFFNGGEEKIYPGEDRVLVPSPKEVRTYDEKPEMSAAPLTDELIKKMESGDYRLIVLNYANSDMVGHTGIEPAAIKAVEVLDQCIGRVCAEAKKKGYDVLITADHGNSECMVDPITKAPHTAHTTNPVPFIWVQAQPQPKKLENGVLADIAPTILEILNWSKPSEMTGHSLIKS
jgi:2,3-bisphosphoglycerate-independent phosphoglycerate mutase